MKQPVIGVMPLWDETKDSYWMLPGYFEAVQQAGGLPLMLPLTTDPAQALQLMELCDGFLFTGGHDVSPSLYGEAKREGTICCPERDEMELLFLSLAMQRDLPILGICRGLQLINAALGGTLWQDLPTQRPESLPHSQKPPYDEPAHRVRLCAGTAMAQLLGEEISVNSRHHQAICELAPELRAAAISEDGLIEAFEQPEKRFLWAVQWHPEHMARSNPVRQRIFSAFVQACGK